MTMTINNIVQKMEERVKYLEEKEEVYRSQFRQSLISDDEYWSLPTNHPKKRKINECEAKVNKVHNEISKLRDMLYEYHKC